MARAKIGVEFDPVVTAKVDRELARLQSQAKGIDFGGGARSLNKLSRPLGKITGQANEFQKSLEASNARVLAFGASVVVINKLSQAFGALVSNTVKVEATFAKINTILGGTERQLKQFGDGIFQVAKRTATAFDEVAEGALELARQGLSVEESLGRVEVALKLVRVAGIDSQEAVAGLTAAIKGFEGAGLTVAAIGDKLAEVDTKFAVSTEDLINGLERASASARVAGVSFDELLAAVTTVQERTQRGGAVIGNAFKTIFARLGRTDTLVALEQLGIQVLDAQGNVRNAVPLFRELATELDKLGIRSVEAGEIIQKVAGVRQRDILINLVEDLNSEFSKFDQAIGVAENSIGALDSKNAQLNKTLDALISKLVTSGQQLASTLGEIGFLDAAKGIVEGFTAVVNKITEILDGEGIGSKFAKGLVAGIGSILTGPGLGLALAIFTKLFIDLAKFGVQSLKSLLGINAATERQNALQQSVLQSLLQNEALQASLLKLGNDKAAQEQLLLKVYQQQINAMSRLAAISKTVTPGLYGKGLRGGPGGVTGKASGGYIASERRDVNRGVGGATPAAQVVSIPNFAFGGGKRGTMVANTSEYIVPNYAGGGDAIFNQNMVKSMGLPPGARKITAAGGYVPNFAIGTMPMGEVNRALQAKKYTNPTNPKLRNEKAQLLMRQRQLNKGKKFADVPVGRFAMIVPQHGVKQVIKGAKGSSNEGLNYTVAGFKGMDAVKRRVSNDEQLDSELTDMAVKMAIRESKAISGSKPKPGAIRELANKGASSGLAGAIFETSVSALLNSKDFDPNIDPNRRFDYTGRMGINKLFNVPSNAAYIEAKLRNSPDQRTSMFGKMKKQLGRASSGYIPNYADPLSDAIGREAAAGVPINQIRINQSGKLRNSANPGGIAVTNTRDEPTGAIPNFVAPLAMAAPFLISTIAGVIIPVVVDKTLQFLSSRRGLQKGLGGQTIRRGPAPKGLPGGPMGTAGILLSGLAYSAPAFMGAFGEQPMMDQMEMSDEDLLAQLKADLPNQVVKRRGGRKMNIDKEATAALQAEKQAEIDALQAKIDAKKAEAAKQEKERRAEVTASVMSRGQARAASMGVFGEKIRGLQGTAQIESTGQKVADAKAFLSLNKELNQVQKLQLQYEIDVAELNEKQKITKLEQLKAFTDQAIAGKELGVIEEEKLKTMLETVDAETDMVEFTKELLNLLGEGFGEGTDAANSLIEKATVINKKTEEQGLNQKKNLDVRKNESDVLASQTDELNKQAKLQAMMTKDVQARAASLRLNQQLRNVGIDDLTGPERRERLALNIEDQSKADRLLLTDKYLTDKQNVGERISDLEAIENRTETQQKQLDIAKEISALYEADYARGLDLLDKQEEHAKKLAKMTPLQEYLEGNRREVRDFTEQLPVAMAQRFETEMNSALNGLRDGTHDTIGEALGQAAINFGEAILQELQSKAIKNATAALFDGGEGGSGGGIGNMLSKGFDFVKNFFTKKNSGGIITGGGGVIDDVPAMLTSGEYVIRKSAVQKYGEGFLNSLNSGNIQGYNQGGPVYHEQDKRFSTVEENLAAEGGATIQGADNIRTTKFFLYQGEGLFGRDHDREADRTQLFGGSASNERLERARGMDLFMPGDRGFGSIVGKENLLAFSQQGITSGSTDLVGQGRINLELQSARLSPLGRQLAMQSPAGQRLQESQQLAYQLAMQAKANEEFVIAENDAARTARREAFQSSIKNAAINAVVTAGFDMLGNSLSGGTTGGSEVSATEMQAQNLQNQTYELQSQIDSYTNQSPFGGQMSTPQPFGGTQSLSAPKPPQPSFQRTPGPPGKMLGGASGGTQSALLSEGEFVMDSQTASSIGKPTLDAINELRYAQGGPVGSVGSGGSRMGGSKADVENVNITINIDKEGNADASTDIEDNTQQAREFSKKVKDVVLNVINEEKRVSGSLFTRSK